MQSKRLSPANVVKHNLHVDGYVNLCSSSRILPFKTLQYPPTVVLPKRRAGLKTNNYFSLFFFSFHLKTISSSLCTILFSLSSWIQCTLYVGEFHKYFWSKLRKLWRRCMKIVSLSTWGPTTDTKCSCILTWNLHLGGLCLDVLKPLNEGCHSLS